jgi:predicted small secreted protein
MYGREENIMLKKTLIVALISTGFVSLGACNTVRGLGQDIESLGDISHCETKIIRKNGKRYRVCR